MSKISSETVPFSHLFKLSLGLLLVSILLTMNHSYSWSWGGSLGFWSIPLAVILAVVLFYFPIVLISHRLLRLSSVYQIVSQLHELTKELTWAQILILSLLAGLGEELLFRGFAQSWLAGVTGPMFAIVLTSIIFALLHAMSLFYFIFALAISIVFGLLLHTTQSMGLVVVLHTVYDVIALGVIAKYPEIVGISRVDADDDADHDSNLSA